MPNHRKAKKGSVRRFLTERAKRTFLPGPVPEQTRYVRPASQIKTSEVAGAYDESFDYENPSSQGYLPKEMDGVIQIKTPEEKATELAYSMALDDPMSVIGPRVTEKDYGIDTKDIRSAGHELEKRRVTANHSPDWLERVREGLSLDKPESKES